MVIPFGRHVETEDMERFYGTLLLKLIVEKAKEMEIDKVLVTAINDNKYSIKVALANGGTIEKVTDERHLIWIDCKHVI